MLSVSKRRVLRHIAIGYFAVSAAFVVAPLFFWWGNFVNPRVLGMPWSLVSVLIVILANFAMLVALYRMGIIAEPEE
jgi:hypothetical protein